MSKKKIVFLTMLLTLTFSGCVSSEVNIILPNSVSLNKNATADFNASYWSINPDPQYVTVNLGTNDPRLSLSVSEQGIFKQDISFKEEVGSNFLNSKRIYVKVTDPSLPYGYYKIKGTIEGEKSTGLVKFPIIAEMTVSVNP